MMCICAARIELEALTTGCKVNVITIDSELSGTYYTRDRDPELGQRRFFVFATRTTTEEPRSRSAFCWKERDARSNLSHSLTHAKTFKLMYLSICINCFLPEKIPRISL